MSRIGDMKVREGSMKVGIKDLSDRYADYILGWDHAIRRAAVEFSGAERDLILSLLKQSPPERDFPRPSGSSFL